MRHYGGKIRSKARRLNCPRDLQEDIRACVGDRTEVDILDMGSGPFSTVGTVCDGVKINLRACDVLADDYRRICDDSGIRQHVPVERADMEYTGYPPQSFDIVYCENALDHTNRPGFAIYEMLRICRSGGWIILRHMKSVGEHHGYRGMHLWNIEHLPPTARLSDGDCRVWNRTDEFLLSSFGQFRNVSDDKWITSKVRKP